MKPRMNFFVGAIALAALLAACGGGPSNGVPIGTGGTSLSVASGTTPASDPVGSVSDSHSDSDAQFKVDLQAKLQELANQGSLCTDNGAKQILGMKISSISHFVDNVTTIVTAAIQAGQTVDKPALIDLLNQYRAEDKAWLANPQEMLAACGWSPEEFQATKAQNSQAIDSLYDGLISLIQSL